ncbi:MAG: hypothetical protein U0136_01870 [Bdellovibrionota bacterium]
MSRYLEKSCLMSVFGYLPARVLSRYQSTQFLRRARVVGLCVFLVGYSLFLPVSPLRAEEPSPKQKADKKGEPVEELLATSGLYLGRIVELDPAGRFIYVRPLEGVGPRRTFYLDAGTLLREQRKRIELKDIEPGRRVGIRYVSEGDIAYAEGVFLIIGEVNPRDLQMPKKKPKVVPGEAEGKEKKAEKSGGKEGAKKSEH